jgi:transcriptional regulator with XRE-family HTH domain
VHETPSEFARLLQEIKRDAGLSDQQVADAAGIDRSQAWRWANAGAKPGYEPVRRLAAWLVTERPTVAAAALTLLPAAGFETPPAPAPALPPDPVLGHILAAARGRPVAGHRTVRGHLLAALAAVNAPLSAQVLAEAAAGRPFTDPIERAIWESPDWPNSDEEKAEEIASYRARRAEFGGQGAETG